MSFRETLLGHVRAGERPVINRLDDLAQRAQEQPRGLTLTEFLTPREVALAGIVAGGRGVALGTFGGFDHAERTRGIFSCETPAIAWTPDDYEIACVQVRRAKGTDEAMRHGDYLGSFLGLGLNRNRLGDIILDNGLAWVFCEQSIVKVLLTQWQRVGRYDVQLRLVDMATLGPLPQSQFEEKMVTLPSLRLDAFLGQAFGMSRTKALEPLKAGQVQLNFVTCTDPAEEIQEGDMVSLRGHGRSKVLKLDGVSRKGRLFIRVGRYF